MIVLDASVVIAFLAQRDANNQSAFEILDTEEDLTMHPLSIAGMLVRPTRDGRAEEVLRWLENVGIERFVPPADEPERLAVLRTETGLKLPDCCVLAAAEHAGASLATFDMRLGGAARQRGLDVLGAPSLQRI